MSERSTGADSRVLVADDHDAFRRSLTRLLQSAGGFDVIAEAEDGKAAVRLAAQQRPDLALIDDDMPGLSGVRVVAEILDQVPHCRVVVFSLNASDGLEAAALRAGAAACLSKDGDPREIIDTLRSVTSDRARSVRSRQGASEPVRPDVWPWIEVEESDRAPDFLKARREMIEAIRGERRVARVLRSELERMMQEPLRELDDLRLAEVSRYLVGSRPFDRTLVGLTLLDDKGESAISGRWAERAGRHGDLREVLGAETAQSMILLGPPGSGKSVQLEALAVDTALEGLKREVEQHPIAFRVSLAGYQLERGGRQRFPRTEQWLAERWAARYPNAPDLESVLTSPGILLLLDGLNEIPAATEADRRTAIQGWTQFIAHLAERTPAGRVLFACRSLDYGQPLSSQEHPVLQIRIEDLSDEQLESYLVDQAPSAWKEIEGDLERDPRLGALRSPFFLTLFAQLDQRDGERLTSRSGLISTFVRRTLVRELDRGGELFRSGLLLNRQDQERLQQLRWPKSWHLPKGGILIPKLCQLAYAMQSGTGRMAGNRMRVSYETALEIFDDPRADSIVEAGITLGVLVVDETGDSLQFSHQLVQECFAAHALVESPDSRLVAVEWRADRVVPDIEAVIRALVPSDPLPPLPTTGWEETMLLAIEMDEEPAVQITALMNHNLAFAGRSATQPMARPNLPDDVVDSLRWALVDRSRDPRADLRNRIACGLVLGDLGDPRFQPMAGPDGSYLLPPLGKIPRGRYTIGDDDVCKPRPSETVRSHIPRHTVELGEFSIGRFAVTNAEFAHFIKSGGYDEPRWWDTPDAEDWRQGDTTADATRAFVIAWTHRLRDEPALREDLYAAGTWDDDTRAFWEMRIGLTEAELEEHVAEFYPAGRVTEPRGWSRSQYSVPTRPVIGVTWFEAHAYCNWLGVQSGRAFRLPSEAEWEAAARGKEGRRYTWGDRFDSLKGNTVETHVRGTTPVGVFPNGDSPEGISDMTGNTNDWTSSCFGPMSVDDLWEGEGVFSYPYRAEDGREDARAGALVQRVVRGGYFYQNSSWAQLFMRWSMPPGSSSLYTGFRVAQDPR